MVLDFIGFTDLNHFTGQFSSLPKTIAQLIDGTAAFMVLFLSIYTGIIPPPFGAGFIPTPVLTGLLLAGSNLIIQIFANGGVSSPAIIAGFMIDLLVVGFAALCASLKHEILGWLISVGVLFLVLYFLGIPGAFERCANVCPFVFLEPYWQQVKWQVGL